MKILRLWILASVSVFLVACLGPVKLPEVKVYTLKSPENISIPGTSRTDKTLLVTTPMASPGFATSKMVYVITPYNLRYFAKHQWVAPPAQMLLPMLADYISSRGYFKAVLTPPFSGITNYRVNTNLLMLQQEFIQPVSKIDLVMQVSVVDNANNRVIASRRFKILMPVEANTPYSGVLTANRAAARICSRIAAFVVRSL